VITQANLIKIKEAAARLDEKYPLLKERGSLEEYIQPRYSGVIEPALDGHYDQKGSMLGCELLDPPVGELVAEVPTGCGIAQLDLDEVAKVTGKNVGSNETHSYIEMSLNPM
jgi:hypothetical protein